MYSALKWALKSSLIQFFAILLLLGNAEALLDDFEDSIDVDILAAILEDCKDKLDKARCYESELESLVTKGELAEIATPVGTTQRLDAKLDDRFVKISNFELASTEVTQLLWVNIMGSNPSEFQKAEHCPEDHKIIVGFGVCPDFPVESITMDEVDDFISRYNDLVDDDYVYRLPTSKEWSLAAREELHKEYGQLLSSAWVRTNSRKQTNPIATKEPNSNGLYDMLGNVNEWVTGFENAESSLNKSFAYIRGGSYDSLEHMSSALEFISNRQGRDARNGFRLAREPK